MAPVQRLPSKRQAEPPLLLGLPSHSGLPGGRGTLCLLHACKQGKQACKIMHLRMRSDSRLQDWGLHRGMDLEIMAGRQSSTALSVTVLFP